MAKDQLEEEAIERFRNYLSQARKSTYGITDRDVVIDKKTGENFDYQLQDENGNKVAVELFRMVENEEGLAKSRMWHTVTGFLREEIQKKGLKGYLVYTPQFTLKKSEMKSYAAKMAEVIERGIQENLAAEEFTYEGFKFHKIKSLDTISLSYTEGVRSVDSRGTATNSFADKLPKKNKQVDVEGHERILLVVNWSYFVDSRAAIKALSTFNFDQFKNVDKIFFEVRQDEVSLIYDRSVVEAIKTHSRVNDPATLKLLVDYLIHQLADKNKDAFDFIKAVGSSAGNLDWLANKEAKENLVHYGSELLEKNLIDDAMWIVRMLENDPNPNSSGENDPDDTQGEHNYHSKVLRNEDVRNITTVRGHLCWLMLKIIGKNKPEYYTEILKIIQRYISEKNLYIRLQAIYPLTEFVVKKKAIKNQDGSSFDWKQEERELVRTLPFKVLRENEKYPKLLEVLLHLFNHFRDLKVAEVKEVLDAMIATKDKDILHEVAALVAYFALFRKNDFPEEGPFDAAPFVSIMKDQIRAGEMSIKTSLAWHLWKIMEQKHLPYNDIKEYLLLFWEEDSYDYEIASSFGLVFEQMALVASDDAKNLFEKMVILLKRHIEATPPPPHQWWIHGTENVIGLFAVEPDRLITMVRALKDIWMKGVVYVGDLPTVFETYSLVPDPDKDRVKAEFIKIYEEMKSVNKHLKEVNWNK